MKKPTISKGRSNKKVTLNILYLAPSETLPNNTASSTHILEITSSIQSFGNNIWIYANSPCHFSLAENKVYKGVVISYIRFPIRFSLTQALYAPLVPFSHQKIRNRLVDADVLHERFWVPEFFGCYYARKFKIPFFLEVNSPLVEEHVGRFSFNLFLKLNRLLQFKSASAIITQTATLKRLLERITDKQVFIVPNGVNVDLFCNTYVRENSEKVRKIYGIEEDELLITFVGTFREWHGVALIPLIVKKILKKYSVKFMLVGHGPLLQKINDIVNNMGLRERVIFTGAKNYEKIPIYLACSDVLIAPFTTANYEPLNEFGFWWNPVKIYEYMASGKPIVSFDFEEIRNIVRDSASLAKPGNIDDFVEKIGVLIENEALRKWFGNTAFKIASNEYTWKKRAEQILKIYQRFQC